MLKKASFISATLQPFAQKTWNNWIKIKSKMQKLKFLQETTFKQDLERETSTVFTPVCADV